MYSNRIFTVNSTYTKTHTHTKTGWRWLDEEGLECSLDLVDHIRSSGRSLMYLECLTIALLGQETGRVRSTDSWTIRLKSSTESKEHKNENKIPQPECLWPNVFWERNNPVQLSNLWTIFITWFNVMFFFLNLHTDYFIIKGNEQFTSNSNETFAPCWTSYFLLWFLP